MRIGISYSLALALAIVVVSTAAAAAQVAPAGQKPLGPELALSYGFVHSNAPQGGCGCFFLTSGSAAIAWPVDKGKFALVGDFTAGQGYYSSGSSANSYSLTLSTFTGGVRYLPRAVNPPLQPFGQVLLGVAHSSGSLVEGKNPAVANAGMAFAANVGGGLDIIAGRRISFRLIEADYLLTTFDNSGNNHQNNLRLMGGIVLHF